MLQVQSNFLMAQRVLMSLIERSTDEAILSDPMYLIRLVSAETHFHQRIEELLAYRQRRARLGGGATS